MTRITKRSLLVLARLGAAAMENRGVAVVAASASRVAATVGQCTGNALAVVVLGVEPTASGSSPSSNAVPVGQ
jgi:hypothetical protein